MRPHLLALYVLIVAAATGCSESPAAPGAGYIEAFVQTSGGDPDDSFEIVSDSVSRTVTANTIAFVQLSEGTHAIELKDVAPNCIVTGGNVISIDVAKNDTVPAIFKVGCLATGINVQVNVTGGDIPSAFEVAVSSIGQFIVSSNSSGIISHLAAGRYQVKVRNTASNCSIMGDSATDTEVINRQIVNVSFNVQCVGAPRTGEIVFVENSILMLVKADGSGQARLNSGYTPSWSRDETKIVYSNTTCDYYSYACNGSLAIVDPLTGLITPLTRARAGYDPAWSPTDDVIAYVEATTSSLYLYNVATGDTVRVALPQGLYIYHPSWSPDGTRLVAGCHRPGVDTQICTFNRDGTDIRYLTDSIGYKNEPAWSPDGRRIVFTKYSNGPASIVTMSPDGSDQRVVASGGNPAWSPDSKQIVFGGDHGLFVVNEDGSGLTRLTDGFHHSPAWRR